MKHKHKTKLVDNALNQYPDELKQKLLLLRQLIIDTADSLECISELEETLKWGQLSFITKNPKTGTTIRIDAFDRCDKNNPQQYAMYVHCRTDFIETFRQMYPVEFNYFGKRAIIFSLDEKVAKKQLSHCVALALTYHLSK